MQSSSICRCIRVSIGPSVMHTGFCHVFYVSAEIKNARPQATAQTKRERPGNVVELVCIIVLIVCSYVQLPMYIYDTIKCRHLLVPSLSVNAFPPFIPKDNFLLFNPQ